MATDRKTLLRGAVTLSVLLFAPLVLISNPSNAAILKSSDYQLQPTVGNSFGGSSSSADYGLVGSGGEAAIGNGTGGSYVMGSGYVAQLTHSINLRVEPSGLVGYWPMNEGAGDTVHDASGNSSDGQTVGNPTWGAGKLGNALSFNNTNYINLGNPSPLNLTGSITISSWFYKTSYSEGGILGKWSSGVFTNSSYLLTTYPNTGDGIALFIANGSASATNSMPTNYPLNQWNYVTGIFNATNGNIAVYLNGIPYGTGQAGFNSINSTTGNVNIGSWGSSNGSTNNFTGTIDDVKIYNRALTPDEVWANYQAGLNGFDSGLVIPPINPGTSQTVGASVIVNADAPYSITTQENGPLTFSGGTATIPPISGTIASPISWVEGATKGLGFTITSGPNGIPAQWASGANYAQVPITPTTIYNRTGFPGGATDVIGLQYRLDVPSNQQPGQYQNTMQFTGTTTP